jgi:hypothetical protein
MLSEPEKINLASYQKRLAIPKGRYIFLYGVIGWGLPVAVIVTIVDMFMDKKSFAYMLQGELWINIIAFMLGGILFGLFTRAFIQKKYLKLKAKEEMPG